MGTDQTSKLKQFLIKPGTCTAFAVSAGISFFLLSMLLPLVGPAGSRVEHAAKNRALFLTVLLITLALSLVSSYSKLGGRRERGGSLPWFSFALSAVCVVTLITLLLNGFAI